MKYRIDASSHLPAYMQLYYQLRRDIVEGAYPFGTKLPSKRLLAEETGTSVITVEHTYSILLDEGYAKSKTRSGYFVIYKESDFLTSPPENDKQKPRPSSYTAEGGFPFSVLSKTMRRVLTEYGENILIKSPNQGCPELREAIRSYLARANGITVSTDQIIIGAGAEYLYSLIVQLIGKRGAYAIEDPSYEKIRQVYEANGAVCLPLPLAENGINSEALKNTEARLLHITPFNSYPSGITADVSKRIEYLAWAEKNEAYIVEDNFDSELTVSKKNEDTVFSLDKGGKVIYVNTFSKTVAPSVRMGYMVLPEKLLLEYKSKLGFYSCTVPVFEQYVLAQLINSGDFERHINKLRRIGRKAKHLVI